MSERPDPDQLLRELKQNEVSDKHRGKLKIFFGYAAGVGKTYTMLKAAHDAQNKGIDVVAGYIEPHTRPETVALLDGLEQLNNLIISYKGTSRKEFDLDGALKRNPQLMLVDELAHSNAPGCRHRKRFQDIEELLSAGIDVYTTVNVQHLESLNDIVAAITEITVQERVPDSVFDHADQVELVDIEPDDLIQRLNTGKIYKEQQAQRALDHFFAPSNLIALREIALRRSADRVNRRAEELQKRTGKKRSFTEEQILICLSASPSNAKVIRTAARMAEAFHGSFTALFVENTNEKDEKKEMNTRLHANLKLAEDLGAKIVTVYGDQIAEQIAEYAKASSVSKIVIGRSNNKRSWFFPKQSLVEQLTIQAPNIDIYVIPDTLPSYSKKGSLLSFNFKFSWADVIKSVLVLLICSVFALGLHWLRIGDSNLIMVYIFGVLITSLITSGRVYGAVLSVVSVLVFNFLFTEPRFTFMSYDSGYPITYIFMLATSLFASSLTVRLKRQGQLAALKAYRTQILLETSQKLQLSKTEVDIIQATAQQLQKLLKHTILFYPVEGKGVDRYLGEPYTFKEDADDNIDSYHLGDEKAVAQWVWKNNKHAGATTNTLPSAKCLYMAVRGHDQVFAVAAAAMIDKKPLDAFQKNLLVAILGECGLALEKAYLSELKSEIETKARQEQLRSNLLRAISHDLRTPLTSISGNAGILMENSSILDEGKKQQLYMDIYDDSMWLINLVENLLSVTRIENGSMNLHMEPELLEEVFQEALAHISRKSIEHHITTKIKDELLMAKMDVRLVMQVIINIVDNAIKYTDVGSNIELSASRNEDVVEISIQDDGRGIDEEAKDRLFDMFYTANNRYGDGRRGLGLGLPLCKAIILAHGGDIKVYDNHPQGTIFLFTLPYQEVENHE